MQESVASKVHDILGQWAVGTEFTLDDVARWLPDERRALISSALHSFALPQYGGLEKKGKLGAKRIFAISEGFADMSIRHHGPHAPHRRKGYEGPLDETVDNRRDVTWKEPEPDPDEPAATEDLILAAAMEYDEGKLDVALTNLRQAFLRIKREQKLLAMKGKLETKR